MVLIAAPDLLPGLKQRAEIIEGKLLTFTDAEALRALEAITIRHPAMVALERKFAATLGGAALINCIKADPSLTESEVRVVSNDTDYAPVSPSSRRGGGGSSDDWRRSHGRGTGGCAHAGSRPARHASGAALQGGRNR